MAKRPAFDVSTITYGQFAQLFKQSRSEYDKVIGTDDPDLSAFRRAGGKLITHHGTADQYIATDGTVKYRQQVEQRMGGAKKTEDFYRLFLAPGTAHCGLNGQNSGLAALTAWVEHGKAPKTLAATLATASGQSVSRNLCAYPSVSRYKGDGDTADAASFRCTRRRVAQVSARPGNHRVRCVRFAGSARPGRRYVRTRSLSVNRLIPPERPFARLGWWPQQCRPPSCSEDQW
ncbi:tannase/feruloyl esterase family alpha/beta hydrolase [Kitasatospora sp. NPDC057223]|uniref:tannase/feruloyl esterase family alpha/beta hydrolase n=1 Tax=Kitasatospora sp. NPDC057223 TaxID=3346055 RepID=UPI003636E6BB